MTCSASAIPSGPVPALAEPELRTTALARPCLQASTAQGHRSGGRPVPGEDPGSRDRLVLGDDDRQVEPPGWLDAGAGSLPRESPWRR